MAAQRKQTVLVAINGAICPEDVPNLCETIGALLRCDGAGVVLVDVGGVRGDASAVDALARIALAAQRLGVRMMIRNATPELEALVRFVGVAEALGLEPLGQPEQGEQTLSVEEEGDLGDLPA